MRQLRSKWSFVDRSDYFVIVYGMWMSLYLIAPVFIRIGWDAVGETMFYMAFVSLLPIHGIIFLSACSNDDELID